MDNRQEAIDAVYSVADDLGLIMENIELDGCWHRVPVSGKKSSNQSGAYCLSELILKSGRVVIVGLMNNWVTSREERLTLNGVEGVTPEELQEAKKRSAEAAKQSKLEKQKLQQEIAEKADGIWRNLPDSGQSEYLNIKRVKAWGIRFSRGAICVPARDIKGKIWTLQWVYPNSEKRFLTGGAKRGHFHLINRPPDIGRTHSFVLGIAEGYATAASLHETLKHPVAVAFDANNLLPVAQALRGVYPSAQLVFFADHDIHRGYPQAFIKQSKLTAAVQRQINILAQVRPDVLVEVVPDDDTRLREKEKHPNKGVSEAIIAAAAVDGVVVIPRFNNKGANA